MLIRRCARTDHDEGYSREGEDGKLVAEGYACAAQH
jgi:hypothetical protein